MIIVKLKGGIGNQLFQYAFGRSLATLKGTTLKLDTVTGFKKDPYKRSYSLGCFNIQYEPASQEDIAKLPIGGRLERLYGLLNFIIPYYKRMIVIEPANQAFLFDNKVFGASTGIYYDGYWQTEKYYNGIAEVLRSEYTFNEPLHGLSEDLAEQIKATNSICLHIRRQYGMSSDGRTVNGGNKNHNSYSSEYYQKAIEKIISNVSDPHFYVFSDDPKWVVENFSLNFPTTYVDHNNGKKDYEDLHLMSLCNHFIIANSTFSWWGAWLGSYQSKIVIAPKKWMNLNYRTDDLFPVNWTVI